MATHGIIVFGASGSGTTTLGREIAKTLNFTYFDADDFFGLQSDAPFTVKRPREERISNLLAAIKNCRGFVISSSIRGWEDPFLQLFDLAIYLSAPTEIRFEPLNEEWINKLTCPVLRVNGTQDYYQTATLISERYYTKPNEPWQVKIALPGELGPYRFVVIFARMNGKWIYARHKKRNTWETAGGHIESGETPYEAAKRELYEETGAIDFELSGVFDYGVHSDTEFSYGRVFIADVRKLGELPESEIAEVRLFDSIPDSMTYPQILPVVYQNLQAHLTTQSSPDEIWDVYDENRKLTGRTQRRGDPLPKDDYHIVVHVWLMNSQGEFLITKRAPMKAYPLMWESTGGSAIAGDSSLRAAIREVKEETGLDVLPERGEIIFSFKRENDFCDIWLFRQDFGLSEVVLQDGETINVKWASHTEIRSMVNTGEFISFHYLEELFEKSK